MKNATIGESDQAGELALLECKFCREPIHGAARICKECGEPQGFVRRFWRLISEVLSVMIALISLGFAYQENRAATAAKDNERAQQEASEAAVERIVANLDLRARAQLNSNLNNEVPKDARTIQRELRERPTDVDLRRDLLLRKAQVPLVSRDRPER